MSEDELMFFGMVGGFVLLMLAYGLSKASLMRDVKRYHSGDEI